MPLHEQRLVTFVTYDGMRLLDLTGPLDALALPNEMLQVGGPSPYILRVLSERGGLVSTSSGLAIPTEPLSSVDGANVDTLIVAGGAPAFRPTSNPLTVENWLENHRTLVDWISRRAGQTRRVCSVCTGGFRDRSGSSTQGAERCHPLGVRPTPIHVFSRRAGRARSLVRQ